MPRRSAAPTADVPYLHVKQIEAEADLLIAEYSERFEPIVAPPDLPPSLSFDVSHPNSTNLKSKSDRLKELGQKYLKQWGVDRAAAVLPLVESA